MENDYLDSGMTPAVVTLDTTTPRIFGVLNIIFSLLAACMAAYMLMTALLMPAMFESIEKAQVAAQEETAKEIEELEEKEAAATTEEEKADIRDEIDELESTSSTNINSANPFSAMKDPLVLRYSIFDGTSGLIVNLLMLISGIGLLLRKEWARKLAVCTAGLKIIRLIGLQAVNMMYVIPITVKHMQEMFAQMEVGGGPGMTEMAGIQGTMLTAWAVILMIGGSIYPAVSLWFLRRPGVKAACQVKNDELAIE